MKGFLIKGALLVRDRGPGFTRRVSFILRSGDISYDQFLKLVSHGLVFISLYIGEKKRRK